MSIQITLRTASGEMKIPLSETPVYIGRSSSCNYKIDDETLSKKHCKLYISDGLATVKDIESKNGTFVNGAMISESHIYLGDKVKIGENLITLDRSTLSPHERKRHASRTMRASNNLRDITYKG